MVFPSVYEMFVEDLTTVRKQHFWEYFSGATLNSRWTTTSVVSGAMSDSVDGGYSFASGTGTWDTGAINFNQKRTFSPTTAVAITVAKRTGNGYMINGFNDSNNTWGNSSNEAAISNLYSATYLAGFNADGTTQSQGNLTQAVDTDFHTQKVECGTTATNYSIDNVLGLTRGTNKPIAKMQPIVSAMHYNSGSAPTAHVNYMECYNT
jgi:hypothetical protein